MNGSLHHSGARYRISKKRHFSEAISALSQLDEGSIRLPESVCHHIWRAVQEVHKARQEWLFQHRGEVHNPWDSSFQLTEDPLSVNEAEIPYCLKKPRDEISG